MHDISNLRKTNIHRTMSFFYDNCASAKFLLLSKEKVADGGTRTNKFVHIFRRRMTDKVILRHLFRHQVAALTLQFSSNHCHLLPPSPQRGEGISSFSKCRHAIESTHGKEWTYCILLPPSLTTNH